MTQPPQDPQQPYSQPSGDQPQYGQPTSQPQFGQQQPYGAPYQGQPQFDLVSETSGPETETVSETEISLHRIACPLRES